MSILSCSAAGCESPVVVKSRALCRKHYGAWYYESKKVLIPARDCAVCGSSFQPKNSLGKFCSKRCVDRGKPSVSGLTCVVCAGPMVKSRTSKPQGEAAHNKCRQSTVVSHGEGGYKKGCRCGVCRGSINEKMREYAARRKERDGIGPTGQLRRKARGLEPDVVVECFICKEPLQRISSSLGRYPLHKKCKDVAPDWVRRGRDNPRPAQFQAKIDKAAAGTSGGGRVFTCGGCAWCGEYFVGVGRTCSKACSVSAKFKRRSSGVSFSISPRVRLEIYERDNWTCQLCENPVSKDLHYLDNWAPSLDHIIPQSHMLIPDHSPSNLRLAHRWCNSARGDGSNMTEDAFMARIDYHFGLQEAA